MILTREELLRKQIIVLKQHGTGTKEQEAKLAELLARGTGGLLSGGSESLQTVEEYLHSHFTIKDWVGVRIVFGFAAALYVPGEMLWIRFVGASRSGKTELLRSIVAHADSKEMEVLTPAAIRGGLKEQPIKLLGEINGYRVITKDLAPLLTTRKDVRSEVFGLLRSAKDGRIVSDFGSEEGHLEQDSRFDWLAATTPYFEQHRVLEALLGERFIDLWWISADREEMAIKAVENNPHLAEIRKELADLVVKMLDKAKEGSADLDLTLVDNTWLGRVGNLCALLRTSVLKDEKGHITSEPQPEVGTDLAQGFQKTALGLQLLGVKRYQPYIARLVRDCVPSVRRKLVLVLVEDQATVDDLARATRLPRSTIEYYLKDLLALDVITRLGNTYTYRLKADLEEKIRSIWKQ